MGERRLSDELTAALPALRELRGLGCTAVRLGQIAIVFDGHPLPTSASAPSSAGDGGERDEALFDSADGD